jgi:hypothetical protein
MEKIIQSDKWHTEIDQLIDETRHGRLKWPSAQVDPLIPDLGKLEGCYKTAVGGRQFVLQRIRPVGIDGGQVSILLVESDEDRTTQTFFPRLNRLQDLYTEVRAQSSGVSGTAASGDSARRKKAMGRVGQVRGIAR